MASKSEVTLYLRVRMQKSTFYLDFAANQSILDIKNEIAMILPKYKSENIRLYNKEDPFLEENKILKNLNINEDNAQAHKPFEMGMSVRDSVDDEFELPVIADYIGDAAHNPDPSNDQAEKQTA